MEYDLNGIPVQIERRKIKNLHLYIKPPGTVLCTAPMRLSEKRIEEFLWEKEPWVRKNVERMRENPVTTDPEYVTGDIIAVWGTLYELVVREGTRYSLKFSPILGSMAVEGEYPKVVLTVRAGATAEQRVRYMDKWYKGQTVARLAELIPEWEAYTGLTCSGWNVRKMSSRWGSCNTRTNALTFNTHLAEHPEICMEYVILHELAHTKVPNHGAAFKAIEDRYMPEWRDVRKLLNGKL